MFFEDWFNPSFILIAVFVFFAIIVLSLPDN